MRGFIRGKSKELAKIEGGNVFDILTGVAISIMVKDPTHLGPCELLYHDIGDWLSKEEKLTKIESLGSIDGIGWRKIIPNQAGDWANQRDPAFDEFIPLGNKDGSGEQAIFGAYSLGVVTNRDPWAYNMDRHALAVNMARMVGTYNAERTRYAKACDGKLKDQWPEVEAIVDADPKRISWTRALKADVKRGKVLQFDEDSLTESTYRPFNKQWLYFSRRLNEMVYQIPKLFPTARHSNIVISCTGVADRKGFSAFIADLVPSLHLTDTGQCFPLYWYEKVEDPHSAGPLSDMFAADTYPADADADADGYIRHDAITDWALATFRDHYNDQAISKEDIFWYVYGILHSPEYKQRFATDLKKMLPRIPFAADFRAFCDAGRKLGEWHLNYETVDPFPLTEESKRLVMEPDDYRVSKMVFGKKEGKPDKTVIVYNEPLTLRDIPLEAYEYVVNGKPALEWIMERYAVTVDKASGIKNDPNAWSEDPRYIVDLVKRIVRVSLESARIVKALPALNEATS